MADSPGLAGQCTTAQLVAGVGHDGDDISHVFYIPSGIVGGSTFLLSSLGLSHVSPGNRWKLGMHALTGNPNELALEEDCLKSK